MPAGQARRFAPILQEASVLDNGIEVVFFGTDRGDVEIRDIKMQQNFSLVACRSPMQ